MSGGGNSAAKAANEQEQQRQASIARTQSAVNAVFDNPQRAADIQDFVNATRDYYLQDLNQQKADADRGLKFALAKSGLTGGSTQVDQQQRLGQDYSRGLLQAEQKAQGAGASLQAADQDARAKLISLATSGLDATTAAQQSAAALQSNIESSESQAKLASLGDAFADANTFVQQAKDAQQRRQGYYSVAGGARTALYGGTSSMYGGGA